MVIYNYGKFVLGFGSVAVAVWKVVQWVKEIRTKDFADLRVAVTKTQGSIEALGHKVDAQTNAVVNELRELRSDFRTFYTQPVPQMLPAQSKPKRVLKPRAVVKPEAAA
jgi:hypothetical protein